jgi:hypothetical protein
MPCFETISKVIPLSCKAQFAFSGSPAPLVGLILAVALWGISGAAPANSQSQSKDDTPALRPALNSGPNSGSKLVSATSIRHDQPTAVKMAGYRWLDKMVAADPSLVSAICIYQKAAKVLASHPHLDKIAEADHYTCRRITKWKSAARILVANPKALRVVTLDPEGIYRAIKADRTIARRLSKNFFFDQMIVENPDLGKFLANYM